LFCETATLQAKVLIEKFGNPVAELAGFVSKKADPDITTSARAIIANLFI
jgi:hypothetical protein